MKAPLGAPPVLQWCLPEQLQIDDTYQRSLAGRSPGLIRWIANNWDWGLCQPLVVARRDDGALFVVDGQHRLSAARLRGDIAHLPGVIGQFGDPAGEARAFVALNQRRRALNQLQLFRASLASGDPDSRAIVAAIEQAGLKLASTTNNVCERGSVANIAGLRACFREHGQQILAMSLTVLARAWPCAALRYAGTLFPGIAAIAADEVALDPNFARGGRAVLMIEMIAGAAQEEWYKDYLAGLHETPSANRGEIAKRIFRAAWAECLEAAEDEEPASGGGRRDEIQPLEHAA